MNRQQLVGRRPVARRRMVHLVKEMQPLGVGIDQLRGDAQHVALFDLALVGHMGLEHIDRMIGPLSIGGADSDMVEQSIGGAVEHQHVIGDVHVAVIVDPRRLDGSAVDI